MPESLPVYPKPLPDEWLGSWTFRLARANELESAYFLLDALQVDSSAVPDNRALQVLSEASRTTVEQLRTMQTPLDPLLDSGVSGNFSPVPLMGVVFIQVCPQCLWEDAVPYVRLPWVRRSVAYCRNHEMALTLVCQHCAATLLPEVPRTVHRRRSRPFLPDYRHCWACQADLGQAGGAPLQFARTSRSTTLKFGKTPVTTPQWERFSFAVWTFINAFGLNEVLVPGAIQVRAFSRKPRSPHSVQQRLAAQLVEEWLLDGLPSDGFPNAHQRLNAVANALLGLLEVRLVSDKRFMYAAWLATRLTEDQPNELLTRWPRYVSGLATRLSRCPPQPLEETVSFTEEEWGWILPILQSPTSRASEKSTFVGLIFRVLFGKGQSASEKELTNTWIKSGQLGAALQALYHRATINKRGAKGIRETALSSSAAQRHIARLLLTDGVIELARKTNRPLHQVLLTALMADDVHLPMPWQSEICAGPAHAAATAK